MDGVAVGGNGGCETDILLFIPSNYQLAPRLDFFWSGRVGCVYLARDFKSAIREQCQQARLSLDVFPSVSVTAEARNLTLPDGRGEGAGEGAGDSKPRSRAYVDSDNACRLGPQATDM